ncbi:MAG: response regulator [Bdellovibrionales bacterium]|nr:response regulator [Bdellovibrionales bacterium]
MRILIVEDDKVSREMLKKMLQQYGDCEVADNGESAFGRFCLAYQDGNPFDLICVDIVMPEVDGHEFLAAVRAFEEEHGRVGSQGVKAIVTTGLEDPSRFVTSDASSLSAYLSKPINPGKLKGELIRLGFIN